MKRIIIALAAALVTLAALCQSFNDSTVLTQQQWQHALAIVAQNTALNDGYGQATAQFDERNPQGYTLDDLNEQYRGKRNWDDIYAQLKKRENDGGNVAAIKQLSGSLAGSVATELQRYVEGQEAPAPAPAPVGDSMAIDTTGFETVVAPEQEAETDSGWNMHWFVDVVLAMLALTGIGMAWNTRRALDKLRQDYVDGMEAMNNSLTKFADDVAAQIDNVKVHNAATRARYSEPAPQQQQAFVQPARTVAPRVDKGVVKKTIYLSKPDENETFIRATEEFELGNSIFVLTTTDGKHGEYSVIENRDVHRFALMMPGENLTRACSGHGIQMANGMTRIVTDRAGEATFENGQWHVSVKATIHYE